MIDLNDIALFVQVVRAGSFAEASRRFGIPANTASRRMRQLEEQLGLRLLHRSTRKLTLTDAGQAFYARCADQVEALSAAAAELGEGSHSPSGKVRVAAPADIFNWFQLDWIAEFLATFPKVRLEFVLSDERADLVAESIDVAMRAGKVREPTLVARRLGRSGQSLVASPAYLAARGTPLSVAELSTHDCVAMPGTGGRTLWRLDGPDGQVLAQVTGRFHANSANVLVKAAVAGLGIGLLPDIMIAPLLRSGELRRVLPEFGVDGIEVNLVYLSQRQLPQAVRAFIDFVITQMRAHGLVETEVTEARPSEQAP